MVAWWKFQVVCGGQLIYQSNPASYSDYQAQAELVRLTQAHMGKPCTVCALRAYKTGKGQSIQWQQFECRPAASPAKPTPPPMPAYSSAPAAFRRPGMHVVSRAPYAMVAPARVRRPGYLRGVGEVQLSLLGVGVLMAGLAVGAVGLLYLGTGGFKEL